MKIATHNSCTGERGYSWTKLFTLFSRCQNKTIEEQYKAGVRYFDVRVKLTDRGWVGAHGLWQSKKTIDSILQELNSLIIDKEDCYVSITYEGEGSKHLLERAVNRWREEYYNITFVYIASKKPKWTIFKTYKHISIEQCYKKLDFSSWHTIIPIPWLWKKIYYNNPTFNNTKFTMVDFV